MLQFMRSFKGQVALELIIMLQKYNRLFSLHAVFMILINSNSQSHSPQYMRLKRLRLSEIEPNG